jgi:hypothetical protein
VCVYANELGVRENVYAYEFFSGEDPYGCESVVGHCAFRKKRKKKFKKNRLVSSQDTTKPQSIS